MPEARPGRSGFKNVLVAIDGSENSNRAVRAAIELAKKYDARLIGVNVIVTPTYMIATPAAATADLNPYWDASRREAREMLNRLASQARREGVEVETRMLERVTSAVQAITTCAVDEKADLIVLGTRGLGGFRKMLLGSVSSGVLSHAHCSVLVVR